VNLVLDTNIVLDLWVFRDEGAASLRASIAGKKVTWFGTAAMREELACVLAYEQIGARMSAANVSPQQVLDAFDEHATLVPAPPAAAVKCRDGDDQKFIDLAVAQRAMLLSKDKAVLSLRRKLATIDVAVARGL
jgi:putative PIN family toxin of toxin-antitoxin system